MGIRATDRTRTEITVPRAIRARARIEIHQAALREDERTVLDRIPVTTPPRTLLDLAAVLPPHQLERAINETERRRLTDVLSLETLVARYPRHPGTRAMRRILEAGNIGRAVTRNDAEALFLAVLDAERLPRPESNAPIALPRATFEADFLWRPQRLIAELDGFETHGTRAAFEADRAKDRALQAAGYRVVRITWRQLNDDTSALAAELRALIESASPWPGA